MTSVILIVKWHGVLNHADTIKVGRKDSRCQCNECCVTWSSKREKRQGRWIKVSREGICPPPQTYKQNLFIYYINPPPHQIFRSSATSVKIMRVLHLISPKGGPRDFLDCILRTKSIEGSYISEIITWLSNLEGIYMIESRSYTDFVLLLFKVTTKVLYRKKKYFCKLKNCN